MLVQRSYWALMVAATLTLVGSPVVAFAQEGGDVGGGSSLGGRARVIDPAEQLNSTIALEFDDQPLSEVLAYMSDVLHVQIYVKWDDVNETGIGHDATITMHLQQVRAELALQLILESLSSELAFYVRENLVVVTTESNIPLETRVYNVRDLLVQADANFVPGMAPDAGVPGIGGFDAGGADFEGDGGFDFDGGGDFGAAGAGFAPGAGQEGAAGLGGGGIPGGAGGLGEDVGGGAGAGIGGQGGFGFGGGDRAGLGGGGGSLGGGGGRGGIFGGFGGQGGIATGPAGAGGAMGGVMMGPPGMPGMGMEMQIAPQNFCGSRMSTKQSPPLVALIESTVSPETWEVNGGPGTISLYQNMLIVRQDWQRQREIENLIQSLRAMQQQ